jgi:hypothetical protein
VHRVDSNATGGLFHPSITANGISVIRMYAGCGCGCRSDPPAQGCDDREGCVATHLTTCKNKQLPALVLTKIYAFQAVPVQSNQPRGCYCSLHALAAIRLVLIVRMLAVLRQSMRTTVNHGLLPFAADVGGGVSCHEGTFNSVHDISHKHCRLYFPSHGRASRVLS